MDALLNRYLLHLHRPTAAVAHPDVPLVNGEAEGHVVGPERHVGIDPFLLAAKVAEAEQFGELARGDVQLAQRRPPSGAS